MLKCSTISRYFVQLLVLALAVATAQSLTWISLNGPHDARMWDAVHTPKGLAFTAGSRGIWKSDNSGLSWQSSGLADREILVMHPVDDEVLLAANLEPAWFRSIDSGATWQEMPQELEQIACFASDDNFVYAGTVNGVLRSDDRGATWEDFGLENTTVTSLLIRSNGDMIAGTGPGLPNYRRSNDDQGWTAAGLADEWIWDMVETASGRIVAAAFNNGVAYSDDGSTWLFSETSFLGGIVAMTADVDTVYAADDFGMIVSYDQGESWTTVNNFRDGIRGLTVLPNGQLLAASFQEGVSRSFDGRDWFPANDGLPFMTAVEIIAGPEGDIAAHDGQNMQNLTPFSVNWRIPRNVGEGFTSLTLTRDLVTWAATQDKIFRSESGGFAWRDSGPDDYGSVVDIYGALDGAILALFNNGAARTANDGDDWADLNWTGSSQHIVGTSTSEIFIVDMVGRLWISDDLGQEWTELELPEEFNKSGFVDMIVATDDALVIADETNIFRSDDLGENWSSIDGVEKDVNIIDMQPGFNGTLFYATNELDGLYQLDPGGEWVNIGEGLGRTPSAITYDQNGRIYAATLEEGIWRAVSPVTDVREDTNNTSSLFIHPQPAFNTTRVDFGRDLRDAQIVIHDLRGTALQEIRLPGVAGGAQLNLNDLAAGAYVLRVRAGEFQADAPLRVLR